LGIEAILATALIDQVDEGNSSAASDDSAQLAEIISL
jgi:hypothetical protein